MPIDTEGSKFQDALEVYADFLLLPAPYPCIYVNISSETTRVNVLNYCLEMSQILEFYTNLGAQICKHHCVGNITLFLVTPFNLDFYTTITTTTTTAHSP